LSNVRIAPFSHSSELRKVNLLIIFQSLSIVSSGSKEIVELKSSHIKASNGLSDVRRQHSSKKNY